MRHSTRTSWVIRTVGNSSFFKMSSLPFNCPQVPSTPQQDLIKRLIIICPPSGMDNVFRDDKIEFLGFNVALSTFPVMSGAALSRWLAEGKYESASSPCTFHNAERQAWKIQILFQRSDETRQRIDPGSTSSEVYVLPTGSSGPLWNNIHDQANYFTLYKYKSRFAVQSM